MTRGPARLLRLPAHLAAHLVVQREAHPTLRTPCVLWCGTRRSRNGYGRAWCPDSKRERQVHRLVWELHCGPVAPGYVLDHLCRRRDCAAPWHLEPVTVRENTHRGDAKLFRRLASI